MVSSGAVTAQSGPDPFCPEGALPWTLNPQMDCNHRPHAQCEPIRRRLNLALVALTLTLFFPFASIEARATETDQFTLPPRPLDDIGPDISIRVLEILRGEIAKVNQMVDNGAQQNLRAGADPFDDQYLASHFYGQVGPGLPESSLEREIHYGDYQDRNVRFQPPYIDSVYAWYVAPSLTVFFFAQCPTIRAYGVEFGTDKIGHIVQQGFEYLNKYNDAREKGLTDADAVEAAVQYGVMTEDTFFGILMDGVYSNGDLAANFGGFKFYRNLFHEVTIGDQTYPPIVKLDGNHWVINPERANSDLLKPYISDHLNEAYNPSKYPFNVDLLRRHVHDRCVSWFERFPDFNESSYRAHLDRSKDWFGEDYGWDLPESDAATLLECFK